MAIAHAPADPSNGSPRRLPRWFWPAFVIAAATIPVAGVFTTSKLFYVRDLTLAFRSRHLWLRDTLLSGTWPWWDPWSAGGQAAFTDALYQIFLPPAVLVRLLLPEVIGFNVWVALPLPLAALGGYLFLRRHVSNPAAALGAIVFAASGPIVSTTNFPNLSWSMAAVPWVFWGLDRVCFRGRAIDVTVLAIAVAMQALAGEPVTLAGTGAIAVGYAAFGTPALPGTRLRAIGLSVAGLVAGALLAGVQLIPTFIAGHQSVRGHLIEAEQAWAFHPLAAIELLVPHFFGDHFHSHLRELPWVYALNSQREPFYYSTYLGVLAVMLAGTSLAVTNRHRRTVLFWTGALVATIVCALGAFTPIYPALQLLLPPLKTFRFPVKYLALSSLAVAVLSATAWEALSKGEFAARPVRRVVIAAAVFGALIYLSIAWLLVAPRGPAYLFLRVGQFVQVPYPIQGAEYLMFRARPELTTLLLKVLGGTVLLWATAFASRGRRLALAAFALLASADLIVGNATINPTMPADLLNKPAWVDIVHQHPGTRVYVGGRLNGYVDTRDIDAPKWTMEDPSKSLFDTRFIAANELVFAPSGWHVREMMSYDLPVLWSFDFARLTGRFRVAGREERLRFLSRVGTRYCILPSPPYPGAVPLATLPSLPQEKLYDCFPRASRLSVVPDALMGKDTGWQMEGLFQERFDPAAGVLVSEPPPPAAGKPGVPVRRHAEFLADENNRVVVRAGLPADGYLFLADTYDPSWDVDVDGQPAPLMKANGLFRAVHLTPGEHVVTFTYHPRLLYWSAAVSGLSALALTIWCVVERRQRRWGAGRVATTLPQPAA